MRSAWLLRGLLVLTVLAFIACAADLAAPIPGDTGGDSTAVAGSATNEVSAVAVLPTSVVAEEPTHTVAAPPTSAPPIGAQPAPVASTPTTPAHSPTPQSQPTPVSPLVMSPTPVLLRLRDDLDDPLGYCIDVRGFGASIRLDADLQAHSCKSGLPDDQSFAVSEDFPGGGILLLEYGVCLAVADPSPGASILLRPCDDRSVSQAFELLADGQLQLQVEPDASPPVLCVGAAGGAGEPAGGRNHLRRDLMLLDCNAADPTLLTWQAVPNQ